MDHSMAESKTKLRGASQRQGLARAGQRAADSDCQKLMALLEKVTRQPPKMWGPSIVGFGSYRYTCESGRTGEAPLSGFAIRGRKLVVYLVDEDDRQKSLLSKLGKHKVGKSCLYFKRLADLGRSALEEPVANSVAGARRRYG